MTEQEFIASQGNKFHIKLLMYYKNLVKPEFEAQGDEILGFTFPEGEYTIRYMDLKTRADLETIDFLDENDLQIHDGPKLSAGASVKKKKR